MQNRTTLGIIFVVVIAVVGAIGVTVTRDSSESKTAGITDVKTAQFSDEKQNISISYPADANRLDLSPQDAADKFILRASSEGDEPYLITLRYEEGLRIASQLTKTDTIDLLLANIDKAFPGRYPGFVKTSENEFEHQGKESVVIEFSYTGPSGEKAFQQLYIFLRDNNKAYYLSLQGREADKTSLSSTFKSIGESFSFTASAGQGD